MFPDLRAESAGQLLEVGFEGYAIGGLSVGEPNEMMYDVVGATAPHLPAGQPRYLMGVGTPADLVEAVEPGRGPVRLRAADPQRPERPAVHPARAR